MANIVVIEDDVQTARMVQRLLRKKGHTVDTLATGEEGLSKILSMVPDLILFDLGLPDIDGQTVIAVIRQQLALTLTPVIAFTAWAPATAREMAIAYGCNGVITKPIDTRAFANQIEDFLRIASIENKKNCPNNEIQPAQ